jgi:hypothetical protein
MLGSTPLCRISGWRWSSQFGRSCRGILSNATFPIKAGFSAFQVAATFSFNVHPLQQQKSIE